MDEEQLRLEKKRKDKLKRKQEKQDKLNQKIMSAMRQKLGLPPLA